MPEDKDELTAEDKIAQSTGNDTEIMAKALEDEADELIKQAYGGDDDDEKDDKGADKSGKDDKDDDNKKAGKGTDEDDDEGGEEDEVKIDPEITDLLSKLDKSEKRVKDTRADHTRGRQELKEANAKSLELEDTVFKLKKQVEEMAEANTSRAETKTEKAVTKTTDTLQAQMDAMTKLDPDLAAAIKPIVDSMFGKIDDMKIEIATDKQELKNQKVKDANDAHFQKLDKAHDGWEDTMQSTEFSEYLQQLAPRAKRLALIDLKGGSAENIIEIFDEFQESQNTDDDNTTKKEDKIKKAKSLSAPANKKSRENNLAKTKKMLFTRTQIDNMSDAEFAKHEDAIDQAMSNGQIEQR